MWFKNVGSQDQNNLIKKSKPRVFNNIEAYRTWRIYEIPKNLNN